MLTLLSIHVIITIVPPLLSLPQILLHYPPIAPTPYISISPPPNIFPSTLIFIFTQILLLTTITNMIIANISINIDSVKLMLWSTAAT